MLAATVVGEPFLNTVRDEAHSEHEERLFSMAIRSAARSWWSFIPSSKPSHHESQDHIGKERHQKGNQSVPGEQGVSDTTNRETVLDNDDVPAEIDFSKAEVGKFYRPKAVLHIPLYLDQQVQAWLVEKAGSKGVPVEDIANELLRREIAIIEAMK